MKISAEIQASKQKWKSLFSGLAWNSALFLHVSRCIFRHFAFVFYSHGISIAVVWLKNQNFASFFVNVRQVYTWRCGIAFGTGSHW